LGCDYWAETANPLSDFVRLNCLLARRGSPLYVKWSDELKTAEFPFIILLDDFCWL